MVSVLQLEVDVGNRHLVPFKDVSRDFVYLCTVLCHFGLRATAKYLAQPAAALLLLLLLQGHTVDCTEHHLQEDVVSIGLLHHWIV